MTSINQAQSWQDLPPLLTTAEVCQLLRVGDGELYKWVGANLLRRGKTGRGFKYPRQSVRELAIQLGVDPFAAAAPGAASAP